MDLEECFDLVWHDFLVTLVVGLVRKFQRQNVEGIDLDFLMNILTHKEEQRSGVVRCCTLAKIKIDITK